jgi:hypothetical protein
MAKRCLPWKASANGQEVFALESERAAGRFADQSLSATLELIRQPRDATELVIALYAAPRGVVVNGRELADLPTSVEALLTEDSTGRVTPTLASFVLADRTPTELVLGGHVIRDLYLQRPTVPTREGSRP